MQGLNYMITITGPETSEGYVKFFQKQGIQLALKATGRGTASDEIRKYLGLGEAEKNILFASMERKKALQVLDIFEGERKLNRPGAGIAFTVPISSVAGRQSLQILSGQNSSEGETTMKQAKTDHELVLVVAARGHVDSIMDAARNAGATGGTVLHALGTNVEQDAREFYGISLGSERELIMMLVKCDIKDAVMKEVAEKAGLHTPAQSLVFSLPVSGTAGLGER